ncbi:hypothetical protein LCGC14_1803540 [marine sediment metagenome]|uniref:Uncharacterized protein n=1 Tax=marine sediment metagenome TaxID=412755 RepID=A0A0F9GNS8_9ZZZZ
MEKKELIEKIIEYCEENKIAGSFNNKYFEKLVSFEIKNKQTHCKECGKRLEDSAP